MNTLINQNQIASEEWVKPSSWIDIRSGALPNSIYFLVGHAADFSKYPNFKINATVSTSANTYDVFVDGVKQATTASGSDTLLNWQTLNLASGFSTTYPEALTTHIVRVTPSTSTDTFTNFKTVEVNNEVQGALWMHVTAGNAIDYEDCMGGWTATRGKLLEAVTTSNDTLKASKLNSTFAYCENLITVPVLEGLSNQDMDAGSIFTDCKKLKQVKLKDCKNTNLYRSFYNCEKLEHIFTDNCTFLFTTYQFYGCDRLKEMPCFVKLNTSGAVESMPSNGEMEDCVIDLSGTPSSSYSSAMISLGGNSTHTFGYVKGVVLNTQVSVTMAAGTAVDVAYSGMDRAALVTLFNSLPTVTGDIVCNVTGATGASNLTSSDLAIAQNKGWTVTR